ncbi:MAG: tRNA preQ1(34) S-adenosylmethionine ribosyltransferase-isomerase QueA [Candidatus Aminicenantes bacterium]|nr:tRNA preQ1(34) S-adenosylmethionine ribosyltransferase-isomerase QueA [Candidatus Aminicenantes bacterium]
MLTSDFDYSLPPELIAQHPLPRRDASRLMILDRRTGGISETRVQDLAEHVSPGDVLVFNASRVLPARAWGERNGADIEFLFLSPAEKRGRWEVLCRPARRATPGSVIRFGPRLEGRVAAASEEGRRTLDFGRSDIPGFLRRRGYAPLPPYIRRGKRPDALRSRDLARYQTVFARRGRSIAAPTAGLHFTPSLLRAIKKRGGLTAYLSLEVGWATFQPLRSPNVEQLSLAGEDYHIPFPAARTVNAAKRAGRPVTAVGTTVVRALESAALKAVPGGARVPAGRDRAGITIRPGFEFKVVDRLLTNFHLPQSSLLILTAAFAGREFLLEAYRRAVGEKYRFFSYGDCMLIL